MDQKAYSLEDGLSCWVERTVRFQRTQGKENMQNTEISTLEQKSSKLKEKFHIYIYNIFKLYIIYVYICIYTHIYIYNIYYIYI